MRYGAFFLLILWQLHTNAQESYNQNLMVGREVRLGETTISYLNPEFSDDGEYMIWLEQTQVIPGTFDVLVNVWHCKIDDETGAMIPTDGKGFLAFESTIYKRPNMGYDNNGPYYVGADSAGSLIMVRPTDAYNGEKLMLSVPSNPNRRGIFPSILPNSEKQYVYWFHPDEYPLPSDVNRISVEYVDLDDPSKIHIVATQDNFNPGSSWAAMDLAVPRWIDGLPEFTFGEGNPPFGLVQASLCKIELDTFTVRSITQEARNHFDPSPYYYKNKRYIMPGDGNNSIVVYREDNDIFSVVKSFFVDTTNSTLIEPCSALSNEPFILGGNYFSTYLMSECDNSNNGAFVNSNGEVFLIGVQSQIPTFQAVSKAETGFVKNEPEVCVTTARKAFLYYNAFPDTQNALTATYELRMIPLEIRCPSEIVLNEATLKSQSYTAVNNVYISGLVSKDSVVALEAGFGIQLNPAFEVVTGGELRIALQACTSKN